MSGHCIHCEVGPHACAWRPPDSVPVHDAHWPHHSAHATWDDGTCPACAERERIVKAIKARVKQCADDWNMPGDLLDYSGPDAAYLDGMLEAAHIAGGEK